MTLETLKSRLNYLGLQNASYAVDSDEQIVVYTGKKVVTHTYTDSSTGKPRTYQTLEDLDDYDFEWVDG